MLKADRPTSFQIGLGVQVPKEVDQGCHQPGPGLGLWGVGQRVFFLHDGRTTDLLDAIKQHASDGSEANQSIQKFNGLPRSQQKAILDFLRSL